MNLFDEKGHKLGLVIEYDTDTHIAKTISGKTLKKLNNVSYKLHDFCPEELRNLL
jgi:hypothetical protein